MPKKRFNAEQIILKLREEEILLAKGKSVAQVCRQLEVTENTYYREKAVADLAKARAEFIREEQT